MTGIYKIENKTNGKVYIGSSKDINKRWNQHIRMLNNNEHHSIKLQRAWNKYGQDAFEFSVLEECDIDRLLYLEQYYIDKFRSYFEGYNSKEKTRGMYTMEDYILDKNNDTVCTSIEQVAQYIKLYFTDKTTQARITQRRLKEYEMMYIIDILNFIGLYFSDVVCVKFKNNDKLDRYYFIKFDSKKLEELQFSVYSMEGYVLEFTYLFKDRAIILMSEYHIDNFEVLGVFKSEISKRYIGKIFYQRDNKVEKYDDRYFKFIVSKHILNSKELFQRRYGHIDGFMDRLDEYFKLNNLEYSTILRI